MQLPFKLCLYCQISWVRIVAGVVACVLGDPHTSGRVCGGAIPDPPAWFPDPGALWEKPQREWICGHGQGSCRAAS